MYEKLGRMVGRSYEETVSLLIKALKNAEVIVCVILVRARLKSLLTIQIHVFLPSIDSNSINCTDGNNHFQFNPILTN